jgi:hypothetical protein
MQTFMPYKSYTMSVQCLDNRRLSKQAIEAMQIIAILTAGKTKSGKDYPKSMKNHPIVKLWGGYVDSLKTYCNACLKEIDKRGYKKPCREYEINCCEIDCPKWTFDKVVNDEFKSHLLNKDPVHYGFFTVNPKKFDWVYIKAKYLIGE